MKSYKSKYTILVALVLLVLITHQANAEMVDLSTAGSSGEINDALFVWTNFNSTGTGVIDPFVRIKTNDPVEEGYNTDYRSTNPDYPEFDEESNTQHHHSL